MTELEELRAALLAFRDRRGWRRFHTPRHLATPVAIEAAELRSALDDPLVRQKGIDLAAAVRTKMLANETRFPPLDEAGATSA